MSLGALVLIVLILLLLFGSGGPRFGWYGTRSGGTDILGVILLIVVLFVLYDLLVGHTVFAEPMYAQTSPVNVPTPPSGLSNIVLWSLVVGFVAPPIMSVIQQPHWSDQVRALIAFVFCLILSLVTVFLTGHIDLSDYVTSLLLVFVTAISTYAKFWKPTGISPSIEHVTSGQPRNALLPHDLHS